MGKEQAEGGQRAGERRPGSKARIQPKFGWILALSQSRQEQNIAILIL